MLLQRLLLLTTAAIALPQWASAQDITPVTPVLETATLTEDQGDADADDPAFWVNPADPAKSLVITAVKNGGIRVYDLQGAEVQALAAAPEANGEAGRINNVDVVYGLTLADGSTVDIVVAADRGQDILRVFKIEPTGLTEITDPALARAFPLRPDAKGGADQENPLDDQMTIYGITGWKAADGTVWVAGTQRTNPRIGLFRLVAGPDGVRAEMAMDVRVPFSFQGQDLTVEDEENPLKDWNPQFEGLVYDRVSGTIYAGQEDVGIWSIDAATGKVSPAPLYTTRGSTESPFTNPESRIARDVEGLTIFYGPTERYLLASSQGGAHGDAPAPDAPYDDSFAVFQIGEGLTYRGSFRVDASGTMDAVQESDGADVLAMGLPGWPNGLFITQDGYDNDLNGLDGEVASTNFKFVDWSVIANSFSPALQMNPAYDPR